METSIEKYLNIKGIEKVRAEKLKSKYLDYSSFKLSVPFDFLDQATKPELWSLGAHLSRFFRETSTQHGSDKNKLSGITYSNEEHCTSALRILKVNIQSLISKLYAISLYLNKKLIDIATISEHWIKSNAIDKIKIQNYKILAAY